LSQFVDIHYFCWGFQARAAFVWPQPIKVANGSGERVPDKDTFDTCWGQRGACFMYWFCL